MYVLRWDIRGDCSVDPLDVCFGYQLADSRGDIGVIYA